MRNQMQNVRRPGEWLKKNARFMTEEAQKVFYHIDADGFSLASVQNLYSLQNWYDFKYPVETREKGLLGKPLEGGPRPLLATADLAEICGIDEVPAEFKICRLCEKLGKQKPLVLRYWSTVNSKGEIRRFGNFMWPVKFERVRTLDKAVCLCGLPDPYEQGKEEQEKETHLFLARSAKQVTLLRPCYDWTTIQTIIAMEEERRKAAAARIAQEAADLEKAKNKRLRQALENKQILIESLDEVLGY